MKKISISILSLAIFMMTACDSSSTKRQGSDNGVGTGSNTEQGMGSGQESDAVSGSQSSDPVDRAEEANKQKMENSSESGSMMGGSAMEDKSEFMVDVADASMLELELSKLALDRASSPDVKSFAQKMVNDHTKMNQELKSLAQRNNITVPQALSKDKQEAYTRISKLQGKEFDKEYLKEMESRHDDNIDKFESMANNENAQELREFANKHLSKLKEHHHMADQLAGRLENNNSNSGMGSGSNSDAEKGGSGSNETQSSNDTVTLKKDNSDKVIERTNP